MNTSLIKNHLKNTIDNWFKAFCNELETEHIFCQNYYKQYEFEF